jgi:hypothetical protein
MESASSRAQPDQPGRFCPCLLTREEVKEYNKIDERLKCTAEWADDSGKICGKPLGAHPREIRMFINALISFLLSNRGVVCV